ncbi:TIGR02444 family protein [Pseudoalteromonas phenolica]|uniref:TIGR02444 family protein n=1 Tax=Pseudoalteromonas phenolica TaxID=161398 RepID=UPI00110C1065|nr:TIGR02444 family protein [Pseudoalteromonas phenolica]TMN88328.1 TIGR02444 family protein [Pseudoalteromonas phenolica]
MSKLTADTFWQFACDIYSKNGVQPLLLELQDEQQKNVNVCLLLLFLDSLKLQLTPTQFSALNNAAALSDAQLLNPHRLIRQNLKTHHAHCTDYAVIRKQLLENELALEKLQQSLLLDALPSSISVNSGADNLTLYLSEQDKNRLLQCL